MYCKSITLDEKKALLLDMIDEVDRFCRTNRITYFLVGGTLLGAVRHNGYIPWDDDIDIGMKREDYEKFIDSFVSLSGKIKVINHKIDKSYLWPSAKVIHTDTTLIENNHYECKIGVFIDVFPFDNVSGTYKQVIFKQKIIQFVKNLLTLKNLCIRPERSIWKNLFIFLANKLILIPNHFFINLIHYICKRDLNKKSDYICNFLGVWGVKEISPIFNFDNVILHKFENLSLFIPVGYDNYLKGVYGDYMVLPPKDKQITHHNNIAYWNKQ